MTMLAVDFDAQMKSAGRRSSLAAWSGVLLSLLGLALIGWVLSSLNDLHAKLSAVSPKFASVLVAAVLAVLLLVLCLGLRFLWTARRADPRPAPDAAVAADPTTAAAQSLAAAGKQIELVTDEIARRALSVELSDVASDLAAKRYTIVVFGTGSAGKTSVINALLGRTAGLTDPVTGTTKEGEQYGYTIEGFDDGQLRLIDTPGLSEIGAAGAMREERAREVQTFVVPSDAGPTVELIDTPGLNEINGEARAKLAEQIARRADLLLFVVSGDMLQPELEALAELREAHKPIILVFNMIDLYPEVDRQKIYDKIRNERVRELLKPDDVILAAARPRAAKVITRSTDGTTTEHWEPSEPIIAPLKLKILEVLEREGQALTVLNSMLFLDEVNEQIVRRRMELRDEAADVLVWRFTIAKAAAVACVPVAVVDVASGIAIDISMVFALARLYRIPMTRVGVGRLVLEVGKMAGLFTATEVGTHFLIGAAKSFFAATSLLTGGATVAAYASVAPIQGFAAGFGSRVIGEATKVYLRNGASWGPAGPKTVVRHILDSLDRASIMSRIGDELRARLRAS